MKPKAKLARLCLQLALILSLVGLVPTSLAIWGERRAAAVAAWHDPAHDVQPATIAPDLALSSLAGVPDEQVLTLAMQGSELETVRTTLAFSSDLTDQQRLNGWLWLAYRYQETGQRQRATHAYRLAGDGAILSGQLSDLLRTEALLTVGRQLLALHHAPDALLYLQQAALISAHAAHLTDYHRRLLLERIIPAGLKAGGHREDWLALAKAVQKGTVQHASVALSWQPTSPGKDATLVHTRNARRAAAAAWLAALPDRDELADSTRQALRQALLAEDRAVETYTKRASDPAARETQLHWLLLKRRIAAGGAGAGLVPEWETEREQIDAALNAAWEDWLTLYTGPSENRIDPRSAGNAARYAIAAAYWGLYPDAPVSDLVSTVQRTNMHHPLKLTVIRTGTPPVLGWSKD